jgi:glycosyltransferase involved in cell wall biosynthesis
MRVAVVTPYFKEPRAWIERCIASVKAQTWADCDHLLVADGHPQGWIDGVGVRHLKLDKAHGDYGNTPRSIGGQLAIAEHYDAIVFLDADNWFEPDHIELCLETAARTGADVVTADRRFMREDGSVLPYRFGEDVSGAHVDSNCYLLMFGAFHTIPRWLMMPRPMAIWGDRFYLSSLREEGLTLARTGAATVNYLCTWADVYRVVGETPPAFAKQGLPTQRLFDWVQRLEPDDVAQVQRLSGCNLPHYFATHRV